MIRLAGVGCRVSGEWILQDVSLHVRSGEIVGLTGPNGGGKSLLLAVCATLVRAEAGDVVIAGHDVRAHPGAVRGAIGYVPEVIGSYPDMTVGEDLAFFAAAQRISRAAVPGAVANVQERLGLTTVSALRMGRLSRGLLRRVALARALVHRPPVLLLDDPASGLDEDARATLWREVRRHAEGGGCAVIASHDTAELGRHAERVARLVRGRLQGEPEERHPRPGATDGARGPVSARAGSP